MRELNKNLKIQVEKNNYNSKNCNLYNGSIIINRNINLTKNFKSLENNTIKLQNKQKYKINGGKTCSIENLDLSDCDMGQIVFSGKCSVKNISFPIVTTKAHESVIDLFVLIPNGEKVIKYLIIQLQVFL